MDQTKSEAKRREYLKDNLPREAKEKYKIYIFKDDIVDKLEKEHQKYLRENNLNK
ncbi:phage coat protein [Bacillus sp. SKDU12]|nr:phage coat protein [Bacillus sp. SKDU12]